MQELLRRYGISLSVIMVAMTAFWLLALVVIPNLYCSSFPSVFISRLTNLAGPMTSTR